MNKIVLSFDDGPHPEQTPRILDVLAKERVPAVFFVVGERIKAPGGFELVRRAAAEGHLIGNHTFNHSRLTELSPADIRSQILRTHELIAEFRPKPKLFRPPFGACNETVRQIAKEVGYNTVLWDVSFEDWRPENQPAGWVDLALNGIAKRHLSFCLGHDLQTTADHLPRLIREVRRLPGREFVSYDRRKDLTWFVGGLRRRVGNVLRTAGLR
jgi:peptidoglycan-N-acetylglucosamine deacetylase